MINVLLNGFAYLTGSLPQELAESISTARIPEELIMLLSDVQSVVGSKHWCAFGAIPNRLLL